MLTVCEYKVLKPPSCFQAHHRLAFVSDLEDSVFGCVGGTGGEQCLEMSAEFHPIPAHSLVSQLHPVTEL